jgi:glycine amidinotransferase
MSLVSVHNEWDPLEEMIVGIADNARVPLGDKGLFTIRYHKFHDKIEDIPTGPYHDRIIEEAREDLEGLTRTLESLGIVVRRPEVTDHSKVYASPDWQANGEYNFCPRDVLLAIGETIIEAPMILRSRFFETLAYKNLLLEYFKSGARWICAPRPRLLDETYVDDLSSGARINNFEPLFDAANVLRAGRDILYLVSCTGNMLGYQWLRQVLADEYRVHPLQGVYHGDHIDTTITLLRPGLVLMNPERIQRDQVPEMFRKWEILWCPEMVDTGFGGSYPRASIWGGMNLIMVNPGLAVVNDAQLPLIKALQRHKIESIPLRFRHTRTLGGGFHCVTLDVRRRGTLEDYS